MPPAGFQLAPSLLLFPSRGSPAFASIQYKPSCLWQVNWQPNYSQRQLLLLLPSLPAISLSILSQLHVVCDALLLRSNSYGAYLYIQHVPSELIDNMSIARSRILHEAESFSFLFFLLISSISIQQLFCVTVQQLTLNCSAPCWLQRKRNKSKAANETAIWLLFSKRASELANKLNSQIQQQHCHEYYAENESEYDDDSSYLLLHVTYSMALIYNFMALHIIESSRSCGSSSCIGTISQERDRRGKPSTLYAIS